MARQPAPREKVILDKSLEILIREAAPRRIYLFGSRAKQKEQTASDFDFALDCKAPSMAKKRTIREMLEKIEGLYTVDILYFPELDKGFKDLIIKTGKVVYEQK